MAMRKRDEEVVFPNAAGIDLGASSHWAAVPKHLADESVREFGAMTDDLNALVDWLLACGVDTVALESTGVYWIPIYEVLEQRGLKVWLVDARQMKYVPGRKSDVQDCQWLQGLMSLGLLRAAWRPGDEVCVARAVVRQQPRHPQGAGKNAGRRQEPALPTHYKPRGSPTHAAPRPIVHHGLAAAYRRNLAQDSAEVSVLPARKRKVTFVTQ